MGTVPRGAVDTGGSSSNRTCDSTRPKIQLISLGVAGIPADPMRFLSTLFLSPCLGKLTEFPFIWNQAQL